MSSSIWAALVLFTLPEVLGATTMGTRPLSACVGVINRSYENIRIVHAAANVAGEIFRKAGIELSYVVVDPLGLRGDASESAAFHIVLSDQQSTARHVLGAADISAQTAWVLVPNIRDTARETQTNEVTVLAHVVAHELGHLLLGTSEHSVSGVMADPIDLIAAEQGGLNFNKEQIRRMQQCLVSHEQ